MQIGGSDNINRGNSTELFLQKQEMAKKAQDAADEQGGLGNSIHT